MHTKTIKFSLDLSNGCILILIFTHFLLTENQRIYLQPFLRYTFKKNEIKLPRMITRIHILLHQNWFEKERACSGARFLRRRSIINRIKKNSKKFEKQSKFSRVKNIEDRLATTKNGSRGRRLAPVFCEWKESQGCQCRPRGNAALLLEKFIKTVWNKGKTILN